MLVRFAAHQAAIIAGLLIMFPGPIGVREAETVSIPKIDLAAPADRAALAVLPPDRPETSLHRKWRTVREQMRHEQWLVTQCRANPAACPSDVATFFMAIVDDARSRQGRARVGEINRAVNLAVRPASDEGRFGDDRWTSPLTTLASGRGDCEDYSIAKLAALWAAGIAESDTRLVIVRDPRAQEDHAIAMVRIDGHWLALDNRRFTLIEASHLPYQPLFAITGDRVVAFAGRASWAALDDEAGPELSARDEAGLPGGGVTPAAL